MKGFRFALTVLVMVVAAIFVMIERVSDPEPENALVETAPPVGEAPEQSHSTPAPSLPQPSQPRAALTGRAIFASSRQPADEAAVSLQIMPSGEVVDETVTDHEGNFLFTPPHNGYYQLTASTGDWMTSKPVNLLVQDPGDHGPVELQLEKGKRTIIKVMAADRNRPLRGARVHIMGTPGEALVTNGRGEVRVSMTRGRLGIMVEARGYRSVSREIAAEPLTNRMVRVGLHPAASCSGRIVDSEDHPLAGALVIIRDILGVWNYETYTDEDGLFVFNQFPRESRFMITVWKHGYATASQVDLRTTGEDPHRELKMVLYPGAMDAFLPGGVVKNKENEPISGAVVQLKQRGDGGVVTTHTDHNGKFQFELIPFPLALSSLSVSAEGYGDWSRRLRRKPHWDIVLEDGALLAGRVVNATGDGLDAVTIYKGLTLRSFPKASAITNGDGEFTLTDLREHQPLLFFKPGYAPRIVIPREMGRMDETVVLEEEGILVGLVRDRETGQPIEQCKIKALGGKGWIGQIQKTQVFGRSEHLEVYNREGRFRIAGLVPDEIMKLRISSEGYPPRDFSVMIPKRPEAMDREFFLDKGTASLVVGVKDPDGHVLEGVEGRLLAIGENARKSSWLDNISQMPFTQLRTSDEQGFMVFQNLPANTTYGLVFSGPGLSPLLMEAPSPSDDEEEVHWVTVQREARVYGLVHRDRYPSANAIIVSADTDEFKSQTIVLDPGQETYDIDGLPQGSVSFMLTGNNKGQNSVSFLEQKELVLEEGRSHQLDFGDETLYKVEGYALFGDGAPSGETLFLLQGASWKKATTGANGYFQFEKVESGDYQLVASWAPNPEALGQASLLAGYPNRHPIRVDDADVNDTFAFQTYGALYGFIPPQGSWRVLIEGVMDAGGEHFRSQQPDAKGFFSFSKLPPGVYRIGRFPNGHPADYEVLFTDVVMPGGGRDLDVGLLSPHGRGRVRVLVDTYGGNYDWHFKISANPLFQSAPDGISKRASTEKSFYKAPGEVLLENLGSGVYEIKVEAVGNRVFQVEPQSIQVEPDQRNPPGVRFTFYAGTWLDIVASNAKIASARLVREGETVTLNEWKGSAPPRYDYDEEVAVFFNDTAIIRNLPQGSWTLEVVDAMNRTKHQKVRLEVGREKKVTLNFH